ncbi:MAG: ketoreductase domain-containing protein, partial [Stellaceae bacterium]
MRRRFARSPLLRTALFDIDHPADLDEPFDAVVAANVVHAGADLGAILAALRARLAPGGILGLVELVGAPRWVDLVFGITEGWWRFCGDARRPHAALLDAAGWRRALAEAGFADIQVAEDGDAHAVILARGPADVGRVYRSGGAAPTRLVEEIEAEIAAGAKLSIVVDAGIAGAAALGAARALSLAHPEAIAATFELMDQSVSSLAAVSAALGRTGGEDQLRVTDGALTVARLVRATPSAPIPTLAADRPYIVAGGLGRLGHACARFLIERGARRLLLVGRSPPDTARLAALRHAGVAADYIQLDLTASDAPARLAAEIDQKLGARELGGVVHAVGRLDGATAEIIAAKLATASALERAVSGRDPEFLLLFSSAAGVWGARGHVAYAAANRALDRWAREARTRGVPA